MKTCKKGHQYEGRRCLECNKSRASAWRKANPERVRSTNATWKANHPGYRAAWYKANADWARAYTSAWRAANPGYIAGWRAANPGYDAAWNATWRSANPGVDATRTAAWRATNPEADSDIRHRRRARKRGSAFETVTKAHLKLLFEAQDGLCRYCPTPLGKDKHLDHRIPLARGGAHAPSNVCWSCPTCNMRKHTMTETEFLERIRRESNSNV